MSISYIPDHVKVRLWGKAAGRCEYEGCNTPLWLDALTKAEFNTAYVAHIYADSPGGPRYDAVKSDALKADISNLMLMCDEHHRLIDKAEVDAHPVERLVAMKKAHEDRIEIVGGIAADLRSEVVLYGANVGEHNAAITWNQAALAMAPNRYPASSRAIALGLQNSLDDDRNKTYWEQESLQLKTAVDRLVRPVLSGDGPHVSVFGLAPQPLLVLLGSLICDIHKADVYQVRDLDRDDLDVYQLHREPKQTWSWDDDDVDAPFEVVMEPPTASHAQVAVVFGISAPVHHDRVHRVLGLDVSIWTVRLVAPGNDTLRCRRHLRQFREACRELFRRVNVEHPHLDALHVFPAMPVSACIELGRVHQPKADPPLEIYDEQRGLGGFVKAICVPLR